MIRRLSDRILLIEGGKGGRYPHSHSLYIRDGGGILVDCGSDPGEILRLKEEEGLAAVLMTHYHEDHFLFLSRFPEAEVWASEEDAPALESMDVLLDRYGVAGTGQEPFFRGLFAERFPFRERKVARRIADRERLRLGRTEAVAIVAPGHTPGHLCLHLPAEGILLLADYDLTPFGPWYGDNPGGIPEFRRSARMLSEIGAARSVVSHEEPVHEGSIVRKMEAYLSVIDRREEALWSFLRRGPKTMEEIVAGRIVYGEGRPGPWFDYGERALMGKHLEEMIGRGEAIFEEGRYFLPG